MVDRDRSGFIDEQELQQALSSGYQKCNLRTIRACGVCCTLELPWSLAVPPSVFQVLISKYENESGKAELDFDSFVE
ncbi:hypothetical protein V6N12_035537 [Hibiscus sabdariffa]|uniref:EF-hand domain-containing protein n=1 Tax=Hibiscus sabdariffa TaxID=183260 RepID=A0ABR2EPT6_9ROSI